MARHHVDTAPELLDLQVVRLDLRHVLEAAVAAVPEVLLRTSVICDVASTGADLVLVGRIVRTLLHLEAQLPAAAHVWVTATTTADGLLVTVEDDLAAGALDAPQAHGPDEVSNSLLLARASALARRGGGRLWIEDGADGGLVHVVHLPDLTRS